MAAQVILVEAKPRNPADGAPVTVRLAGGGASAPYHYGDQHWRAGLNSLPKSTASLDFDGEQLGGGGVAQAIELGWAPSSGAALAELSSLYWVDAPITVRAGAEGDALPPVITSGLVLESPVDGGVLKIALADQIVDLKRPLLVERFAGTGGIEGPTEFTGLIKSRAWGRCFNVPGRQLDAAYNIWCFGDPSRQWQAFVQVRDKGAAAAASTVTVLAWQGSIDATFTALRAAQVTEGGGVFCPSIACVKWWTVPAGDLHADIRGEIAGGYVETAAEIVARIVAARSTIPFVAGAVAAAAAARPGPFGWRVDTDSAQAANEISEILGGVSTSWPLIGGEIAFRQWDWSAPVRAARSFAVTRTSTVKPTASRKLGYRRNWSPMARGDLAAIVLARDVAYEDGTPIEDWKPAQPGADVTGDHTSKDTNAVGGVPATVIIADIDRVIADLESALVDVGNASEAVGRLDAAVATFQGKIDDALVQFGSFDLVMPSVLKLAQLVQTTSAIVRARTTLDNQPIGTVVEDVRTKTETVVENVSLMGAASFDRSTFLVNLMTVMVDAETSLGQRFEQIEAKGANDLNAVASDLVTVIVDGETATAKRLTQVEAAAKGLTGTVSGLSQVIADGDKVQADRIDIVEAGITGPGGISAKVQELTSATVGADGSSLASKITVLQSQLNNQDTGVYARIGTLENTVTRGPNSHAERLTTVEAGVSGPNGVTAKVQELTSATIGADGSSLASKVTVLQSQLNNQDTGVYARIGTLENTVTRGPNSHAERLTTVEASVSGPNGVTAKVQELSTATIGGPGTDSLAQKISTVQAQLNTEDTGLFARVGTLNNALFQGGNAIATRLDSVESYVGKDPESGLRAQVSFLTTATVTPGGSAIAKAVLSLDALGRVVGTTATNNGVQGLFDIVFDRTRIIRPDGTLLFRAGGAGNGEDPNAVYMPNVIIDRLRLGAVGTLEIGLGAIRQVFAVELTSNPALPGTNGQQITYLTLYINKQRPESSLRISYNMRPRPGRDYAASFILGRQPLDGSVKTTMDTSQFWAASCLINGLRSVRIPMNLSRTFDGLPAGEYLITVDIIAIGGGNDQGFMEAGSNLYVEEVKR